MTIHVQFEFNKVYFYKCHRLRETRDSPVDLRLYSLPHVIHAHAI